ncbi:aldo/keto reductase [Paraburkholderia sp. BL6669N2]|uniref:aldo/keto reductase n=1 Tax=Paraburkholderia sp. BL6669N2 TaxID=1938807 RepID=UPI0028686690|nr:aldo/keto reductase [Paraburkholderia sp. BL6669N2]
MRQQPPVSHPSKQLHLTTKVWHENLESESLHRALDVSLGKLGVDYVDLYMVHWPSCDTDLGAVIETMQGFLQKGTVRSIGVCNCNVTMLRKAVEEIGASIWVTYFIELVVVYMLTGWLPTPMKEAGIPMAQAAVVTGMCMFGSTFGTILMGWLMARMNIHVVGSP